MNIIKYNYKHKNSNKKTYRTNTLYELPSKNTWHEKIIAFLHETFILCNVERQTKTIVNTFYFFPIKWKKSHRINHEISWFVQSYFFFASFLPAELAINDNTHTANIPIINIICFILYFLFFRIFILPF